MSEQPKPDSGERQKAFKVVGQEFEDPNRRHIEIEKYLKNQEAYADESTFDFLQGKYIFRFPFVVNSINWGFGLGMVFGLHTYFRTRSASNALYWLVAGGALTGLPIFGFFLFRYTFYSTSIKR